MKKTVLLLTVAILLVGGIAIQFLRFVVPEFRLDNPPVTNEIVWSSADAEALWTASCADCHSNETVYPIYAYVAPMGWLVAHDVHEGRRKLNVSTQRGMEDIELEELLEVLDENEMPPAQYLLLHPDAALSENDRETLARAFQETFSDYADERDD